MVDDMGTDHSGSIADQIKNAFESGTPVNIVGGNSKAFYGRDISADIPDDILAETLNVAQHQGVISYDPTELVITARGGTRLQDIENVLAQHSQMLPFEPPHFGATATLAGTLATGLSGPARPYRGAVRDHVLGIQIINGKGETLGFGGQVMKNVAGYDVSRLMVGALGGLGVLLEASLKVLPQDASSMTLCQTLTLEDAIETMNHWAGQAVPLSGACYDGKKMILRLSGSEKGVAAAFTKIGGDLLDGADVFWSGLREQSHAFFNRQQPLWRIAVAPATPPLSIKGDGLIDWGGAQRWLYSNVDSDSIRHQVAAVGGHACLYRGGDRSGEVFHPLPATLKQLHLNLKNAFDPKRILNPGRMYLSL